MSEMKKKVLGRGLGALIADAPAASAIGGQSRYRLMLAAEISPNASQPRKHFDEAALRELADSIRENGIIEPLIVRRTSTGFELIAGERRWRAARMAGLAEVPVVITDATDEESLELAIIENIQRQDLNAIEEAEAYKSLMVFGMSQEAVAKKVGKERATVANYLRLLRLPLEVKDELVKGAISMGHARALLAIEGHAAQTELCRKIISKGMSVRETEAIINNKTSETKSNKPKKAGAAVFNAVEDELRGIFGTKVVLKETGGRGAIAINYFSVDERERLIDLLRSVKAY